MSAYVRYVCNVYICVWVKVISMLCQCVMVVSTMQWLHWLCHSRARTPRRVRSLARSHSLATALAAFTIAAHLMSVHHTNTGGRCSINTDAVFGASDCAARRTDRAGRHSRSYA